jgi:hypothetical protein
MQIKKSITRAVAVTAGVFTLTGLIGFASPAFAVDIPSPPGWVLQWGDDFSGTAGSLPSASNWHIDTGHSYPNGPANWGTSEVESYTTDPANIHLDGKGHLLIVPQRDASGQWTSGRVETVRDDFTAPEGGMLRMEARVQMPDVTGPRALGYWPAFWALGSNYRTTMAWPQSGEFDIMESVNGLDAVWGILHCGINPGGPCGEPMGIGSHLPCPHEACTAGPHTFTFELVRRWATGQPGCRKSVSRGDVAPAHTAARLLPVAGCRGGWWLFVCDGRMEADAHARYRARARHDRGLCGRLDTAG